MRAPPVVTVVVPTFNRLAYLPQAIESALAQTYSDIEVIVSDNAASPEVADLVASYRDARLRYRHNGGNVGATRNALAAYGEARGAFVTTLHDDDVWEPTFLAELLPPLVSDPELALAFSDHWIIDSAGVIDREATDACTRRWGRAGARQGVHRPFFDLALVDRAVPGAVSTVFRRSAIAWDDFPAEIGQFYDLWLVYLASRTGRGAYYLPRRLTRYRVHSDAATAIERANAARQGSDEALVFCFERFLADQRLASIHQQLRRAAAPYHTNLGISWLEAGRRPAARRQLLLGLRRGSAVRALVGLALSLIPGNLRRPVTWARTVRRRLRQRSGAAGASRGVPRGA